MLGLDVVLGLPAGYAERIGVTGFREAIARIASDPDWAAALDPAATLDEVSLSRPFFPRRAGPDPWASARVARRPLPPGWGWAGRMICAGSATMPPRAPRGGAAVLDHGAGTGGAGRRPCLAASAADER
ncbi:hypothetical protein ACFQ4K_16245 [Tistrella bauzanensis]